MIEIRELQEKDIPAIVTAFDSIGWNKPASQYLRYLTEQTAGLRSVLLAFRNDVFLGYLTILWESGYQPFKEEGVPEITDFNVLPHARRRGIGTKLMNVAERIVSQRSKKIGIGVGLDADYGAAQRLYVLRGYVPDGRGIIWQSRFPKYGEQVTVEDGLNLYFTKELCGGSVKQNIAHIALVVRDYDEAVSFYTEKLGFRLLEDTPQSETKRWVLVAPPGSTECSLLLAKGVGEEQSSRIGNQTGGRVFLFLRTDDFQRDYENLRARGVEFVREPKTEAYGTVAVFADLYGNLWDLVEFQNK